MHVPVRLDMRRNDRRARAGQGQEPQSTVAILVDHGRAIGRELRAGAAGRGQARREIA